VQSPHPDGHGQLDDTHGGLADDDRGGNVDAARDRPEQAEVAKRVEYEEGCSCNNDPRVVVVRASGGESGHGEPFRTVHNTDGGSA